MRVLAFDPGTTKGGMAYYDSKEGFLDTWALPVHEVLKGKKKNKQLNPHKIIHILDNYNSPDLVLIEKVQAFHRSSPQSAFTFGYGAGVIYGIIVALELSVDFVSPKTWQKKVGLIGKANKNNNVQKAINLFPGNAKDFEYMGNNGKLVTHDGRADAALIAYYGVLERG